MKENLKPDTALAPVPVVLVSCGEKEKANITTIAWTGIINSEPPLLYVSIRRTRYSYDIIKERKEFALNIPDIHLIWETDYCGTRSGKEMDKFEVCGFTKEECKSIQAPGIRECPITIECKLKEIKPLGSHDMFIAEVVGVNCDNKYLTKEGKIDYANMNLLTYMGSAYYASGKPVGKRGLCLQQEKNS